MDEFTCNLIAKRWKTTLQAVTRLGGRADPLVIEPPATLADVEALEQSLGTSLPIALRDVLLTFSRKVDFQWSLPDDFRLSDELRKIFGGGCHWSIERLEEFNQEKEKWIHRVFSNPSDPYDTIWHNCLAFHAVGNGDFLAVDLRTDEPQPVVYLSHDDGDGHGRELGADFQDFLLRWSRLGCVGAEDWQWLPFTSPDGFLDPDCDRAKAFRALMKLGL